MQETIANVTAEASGVGARLDRPRNYPMGRGAQAHELLLENEALRCDPQAATPAVVGFGSAAFRSFVHEYAARYQGPALAYDLDTVRERVNALCRLAHPRLRFLFATKAFADSRALLALAKAGRGRLGFDVSNLGELELVLRATECPESSAAPVSVTGPLAPTTLPLLEGLSKRTRVMFNVDSIHQYQEVSQRLPESVLLGARIAMEVKSDPGAPELSTRFGLDADAKAELRAVMTDRRFAGLHCHVAQELSRPGAHALLAHKLGRLASDLERPLSYLNLGGGLSLDDAASTTALEGALSGAPTDATVYLEPGALWAQAAGVAICRVLDIKPLRSGGARVVVDLSADCHLRWSPPSGMALHMTAQPGKSPNSELLVVYGPTCYEADLLGCYLTPVCSDGGRAIRAGDIVYFFGISSYAASWNCGFNGVAPARVLLHADA